MKTINKSQAKELILGTNGKFFSVVFKKKDGTDRKMVCRLGVKKHLKGGTLKYNAQDRGLISVWCSEKKAYRMINLETLKAVQIGGQINILKGSLS